MILAIIHWETDDQEKLKKLPHQIHAIDSVDFEYVSDWLYNKYKIHVKSFQIMQRGLAK